MSSASPNGPGRRFSTESNSGKRKRPGEPKFYAVRIGAAPGIYGSYEEVMQQVKGVKNASFKSFPTHAEAQNFMQNGLYGSKSQKVYAVRNGRQPGIYSDWPSAQAQVTGFAKPKYKSFLTMAEAEAYMDGHDSGAAPDADGGANGRYKKPKKMEMGVGGDETEERWRPGTGPLPAGARDGFDERVVLDPQTGSIGYKSAEQRSASKMLPVGVAREQHLRIYTDGSSLKNGRIGAQAGVGVYFGPQDARNVSEGLAGSRQTNQRAELTAVKRAIELAPRDRDIVILSDSKYAINCCTEWFPRWRQAGWQTADKKPVENRDLIEAIIAGIDERFRLRAKTQFEWVKGHASDPGNTAADLLAVEGARRATGAGSERADRPMTWAQAGKVAEQGH